MTSSIAVVLVVLPQVVSEYYVLRVVFNLRYKYIEFQQKLFFSKKIFLCVGKSIQDLILN